MELTAEWIVYFHDGCIIIELSTIIGSWEDGDQVSSGEELVALLNNLMGPANQVDLMLFAEFAYDVCAENKRDASLVFTPTGYFIGICPKQVAKKPLVGDVIRSWNWVDLAEMM